jgi:hypothetical protein
MPEAFRVSLLVRNLRFILDHDYGGHAVRHRNPTHRREAKIRWRILFKGIAKTLKFRVAIGLTSGDEHRVLGLETEQTATYVRERNTANARLIEKAQNAEVALVPVILCGAQSNRITRIVYDSMPERESARRLIDGAVIARSVVLPFKAIVSDRAVNSLRQAKGLRQIVVVRKKEKRIPLVIKRKIGTHEVQRPQAP